MLNNEFRLIGTVVSDYEKGGTENFVKYTFNLEVEKRNKKEPSVYLITVFESNKSIDVKNRLLGKQIILQGYLDEYKGNMKLVAQDIVVIGAVPVEEEKIKGANLEEIELPNDDLPF